MEEPNAASKRPIKTYEMHRHPAEKLAAEVHSVLTRAGVSSDRADVMLDDLPRRWERHGCLALLPKGSFTSPGWDVVRGPALWSAVAEALGATKLARKADVDPGPRRESRVELLLGEDGWVRNTLFTYGCLSTIAPSCVPRSRMARTLCMCVGPSYISCSGTCTPQFLLLSIHVGHAPDDSTKHNARCTMWTTALLTSTT